MIYDNISFFILTEFMKQETTTWKIAKAYKWEDLPLNFLNGTHFKKYYSCKEAIIKNRIRKFIKEGIILTEKNSKNKNMYIMIKEKVKLKKHKFPDGKLLNCIYIKENDRWVCFQLG